jgi:hypothetical protein
MQRYEPRGPNHHACGRDGGVRQLHLSERRLAAAARALTAGNRSYSYDANGNAATNGTQSYTWDGENRVLSAGNVDFVYGPDGKRLKKETTSGTASTRCRSAGGARLWPTRCHRRVSEVAWPRRPSV